MEVAVTTGAIRRAKLKAQIITNKHNFLQAGCPSCHSTNSVTELKENFRKKICLMYDRVILFSYLFKK